jgi:hypothetical protein
LHGLAFTGVIVVVGVIVVSVASYFACDGIVAAPRIGVTAVPVVAEITVTQRPITAQTYKNVLTVVVRIAICERGVRSPVIVQYKVIPGPDCPMAGPVMEIPVNMVVVKGMSY